MTTTKHRVLVVDDNQDAATTMSELLAAAGFDVRTCFDGPSALAATDKFRPDACVLDINMPGMTGYDLAQQLRQRFADRPPLFATMTAYGDHAHLERAVDAGFDLQFTKPADPGEVIEQLRDGIPPAEAGSAPSREPALHGLLTRLIAMWSRK